MSRLWWLPAVLAAIILWAVFYPSLMCNDSLAWYEQATVGVYDDWHPPLPALVLAAFLHAGPGLGGVLLVQCLFACFGVVVFAKEALGIVRPDLSPGARGWLGAGVLWALLLPLSPLAFYFATYLKDTWEAILLLWAGALLATLLRATGARFAARLALLFAVITVAGLVRHNAVLLLPFFLPALWIVLRRRSAALTWLALLPLLLYPLAHFAIVRAAHVHNKHIENYVMAVELVEMYRRWPDLRPELPYTAAHLVGDNYDTYFRFPEITTLVMQNPPVVDYEYLRWRRNIELSREYWGAVSRRPVRVAALKASAFAALLFHTGEWFYPGLDPNAYSLSLNHPLAPVRERWIRRGLAAGASPLRWVFGVHAVWLLAGAVILIAAFRARREPRMQLAAAALCIPLGYAATYLAAAPHLHFRFLYPASLWIQVVVVAWLLARVACPRFDDDTGESHA